MQMDLYNNPIIKAKPFLKWVGGKRQLIPEIEQYLPKKIKNEKIIMKYFEPFIGGGALFFHLKSHYHIKKAFISDINKELILSYKIIQKKPNDLINQLKTIEDNYKKLSRKKRSEYYFNIREDFNKNLNNFNYELFDEEAIHRVSELIFMNKTCFNGLYRVNLDGTFNVPHGKYKNPKICDPENIKNVHKALQNVEIHNKTYIYSKKYIDNTSFVYLDPPYRPLTKTSSFTSYSKEGFDDNDQIMLSKYFQEIDNKKASIMLSNSDPHNTDEKDDFFDDLYSGFNIHRIKAKRSINSNGNKRDAITELLITNYK